MLDRETCPVCFQNIFDDFSEVGLLRLVTIEQNVQRLTTVDN